VKQPSDNSRKQLMVVISTVAVTLVLALIIVFAAFSPASPEGVVIGMLESIIKQDFARLETFVAGDALTGLQSAVETQEFSRWRLFWENGKQLFDEFRVGEVKVTKNQATVVVYYGPGMIQEEEFVLQREKRQWKVVDIIN
jgi:hypothetical protein